MGIFSFGKKEDDAPPRRGSRSGARAVRTERVERRPRRTERPDTDALLLDPTLPEKQRARRRLVGAIALVVAAVIVLPMVLDSHPKPVTDDVQIDIPNRPSHQAAAANDEDASDVQAGVAHDEPPASEPAAAPTPAVAAKAQAKPDAKEAKKLRPPPRRRRAPRRSRPRSRRRIRPRRACARRPRPRRRTATRLRPHRRPARASRCSSARFATTRPPATGRRSSRQRACPRMSSTASRLTAVRLHCCAQGRSPIARPLPPRSRRCAKRASRSNGRC